MNAERHIDAQTQSLLEVVEEYRERECRRRREHAETQAQELLRQARSDARHRVEQAVSRVRARGQEEIIAARAHLETDIRQRRHSINRRLLDEAWPLLREALRRRWAEPETCRTWVESALRHAREVLPTRGHWQVQHPPGWDTAAMEGADAPVPLEFAADPGIRAGLRICCCGACLDATAEGLLGEPEEIESQLLALQRRRFERRPDSAAEDRTGGERQ